MGNKATQVLLATLAACPWAAIGDTLQIDNIVAGENVVVMGDARISTGCRNDFVSRSTGTMTSSLNLLSPQKCNSETAIFSSNSPMLLDTPVNWTDGNADHHKSTLKPLLMVPVRVWIADNTAGAEARAKDDLKQANNLYKANKVGVRFVGTFKNVSASAGAVSAIEAGVSTTPHLLCTPAIASLKTSGVYKKKRLNVYYVKQGFTGRNCAILDVPPGCDCTCAMAKPADGDGNVTYIGTTSNKASLAHEFGHAFGLRPASCGGHTDPGGNITGFTDSNIMWGGGDENRSKFTLGQVFRMHTHTDKWGGSMLIANGLVSGPHRGCRPNVATARCPALQKDWTRP
jgi:hypothetical protein